MLDLGTKTSQSSALGGDRWDRAWQVPQLTAQPDLPPSDMRSEATTGLNLVPLKALGAPELP